MKDGVVPEDFIFASSGYMAECEDAMPPKGIYYFVPKMIKYYLGEEPVLSNAPTYLPFYEEDMNYVLDHFDDLVLKNFALPRTESSFSCMESHSPTARRPCSN